MKKTTKKNKSGYKRIALSCQGGGSLGAYHIGVIKSMIENDYIPTIVSGISIGSFTGAIVAGNDPDHVVEKLEGFWREISWPEILPPFWQKTLSRRQKNRLSSLRGYTFGQPHFFSPRYPSMIFNRHKSDSLTSFYDTSKIRETLLKFVDFDRINQGKTRLIIGLTRVKDGELIFFDSGKTTIGPEHIIASGAMPPGFPGIRIEGDLYWDGGCVSNTPLEGIFRVDPHLDTLCFMVDLFNPIGKDPKNMDEVKERAKDILYASRAAHHIDHINHRQNLKKALSHVYYKLPKNIQSDPTVEKLKKYLESSRFDIVHLIYGTPDYEVSSKDCEFSRTSIKDRYERGYYNMAQAFDRSPWLESEPDYVGSKIYKFIAGNYIAST